MEGSLASSIAVLFGPIENDDMLLSRFFHLSVCLSLCAQVRVTLSLLEAHRTKEAVFEAAEEVREWGWWCWWCW